MSRAAFPHILIKRLAFPLCGADRLSLGLYERLRRALAQDLVEGGGQIAGDRVVEIPERAAHLIAQTARPQQQSDKDADTHSERDILQTHQPKRPARRREEVEEDEDD